MKDGIDLLIDDSQKITTGFMISKKIHDPVLKEAQLNKLKAQAVQQEIGKFDSNYQKQYEEMKASIEKLKSKAHKTNVSKLWLALPVVGWAYYPI